MISLEQVRLLESRVAKAIEYVEHLTDKNAALSSEKEFLQKKLDANQKRLDELEVLVMRFKEDQGRIEDGIMAALDRLSQFEEAFESSLADHSPSHPQPAKHESGAKKPAVKKEKHVERNSPEEEPSPGEHKGSSNSQEFFEIREDETEQNAAELDIF